MSDTDWSDILAVATGVEPRQSSAEPAGVRGRVHRAGAELRRAWNLARFELQYRTALGRHRWLRRHTFVESHLLDLDLGCVQYRGLHCLVCDAPAGY